MPGIARVNDQGFGICPGHQIPLPYITTFTGASGGLVTIGSEGSATCGHTTTAMTGSSTVFADGAGVHRLGDQGQNLGNYNVIMASSTVFADVGTSVTIPEVVKKDASLIFNGVQPGTSYFDAATASDDDGEHSIAIVPPLDGTREPTLTEIKTSKAAGIDPDFIPGPPVEEDTAAPATPPPTNIVDCGSDDMTTVYDLSTQLSERFKLSQLTTTCALSKADVNSVSQQNGVARSRIVCNLSNLAVNVLEPLLNELAAFGGGQHIITSGFRVGGSMNSQHRVGQATDNQFNGFSLQQYWDFARIVKDKLTYDQFILEYIGNMPWFHLSFSTTLNRRQVLTCRKKGLYEPGLIRAR